MPAKEVAIEGVGAVKIYKRKGARSVRLSVVGDGTVRITQPKWLPYKAGIEFAHSRKKWIVDNLVTVKLLEDGQVIGKSFQLHFSPSDSLTAPSARLKDKHITVLVPSGSSINDPETQGVALKAVERALKIDAEDLLIPRVSQLALAHGFSYNSAAIRKLKSRWGSCTSNKDILLSSYLIQLPWNLIDYVILHELQHTEILAHGKDFWIALDQQVENLPEIRKIMKGYQARII